MQHEINMEADLDAKSWLSWSESTEQNETRHFHINCKRKPAVPFHCWSLLSAHCCQPSFETALLKGPTRVRPWAPWELSKGISSVSHNERTLYKCLKASLSQRNQSRRIIKHGFLPKQDAITNLLCISMDPRTKNRSNCYLHLLLYFCYLQSTCYASHLLRVCFAFASHFHLNAGSPVSARPLGHNKAKPKAFPIYCNQHMKTSIFCLQNSLKPARECQPCPRRCWPPEFRGKISLLILQYIVVIGYVGTSRSTQRRKEPPGCRHDG